MHPLYMLSLRERIARILVLLRQKMDLDISMLFDLASEEDSGPALAGCLSSLESHKTMLAIIVHFFHTTYVEGEDCEDVLSDIAKMWEDDTSCTLIRAMSESEVNAGLLRVMRDHWDDNPVC